MKQYQENDKRDLNVIQECKNKSADELDAEFEKFKNNFNNKNQN